MTYVLIEKSRSGGYALALWQFCGPHRRAGRSLHKQQAGPRRVWRPYV